MDWYVDQINGNDDWRGTMFAPFQSYKKAEEKAEPGDVIRVRGIFEGPIVVEKMGITLTGWDRL
jgi:hypothetical protein